MLIPYLERHFYLKKVIVEAYDFSVKKTYSDGRPLADGQEKGRYWINTSKGKRYINSDDFIIIDICGKKSICKRSRFFKDYQQINIINSSPTASSFLTIGHASIRCA